MSVPDFESVLTDTSRSLADYVSVMVGDDPERFGALMELSLKQKRMYSMRAARVADFCCERNPELIRPWLGQIVAVLPDLKDESVKRIFLHILLRHPWVEDEEAMGRLIDTLFRWIPDERQPTAVRAYAMYFLEHVCMLYPDLRNELMLTIREGMTEWTEGALISAGRRTLKRLGT